MTSVFKHHHAAGEKQELSSIKVQDDIESPPAYYLPHKYPLDRSHADTIRLYEACRRGRLIRRHVFGLTSVVCLVFLIACLTGLIRFQTGLVDSLVSSIGKYLPSRCSGSNKPTAFQDHWPTKTPHSYECPRDSVDDLSCHLTGTNLTSLDTCCVNSPGGQILLTQFWDFAPALGDADKWTLHGLWPDNCDGSFEQFCDTSRNVKSIQDTLLSAGEDGLVRAMKQNWKGTRNDDDLWTHEWNKHGTCISTLDLRCYEPSSHAAIEPVVEYFSAAVNLFKTLDTYKALESAGIVPSFEARYSRADILAAIGTELSDGHNVTLGCTRSGLFNEVWYHFNVRGRAQDGQYVSTEPDGTKDSCPDTGIKYFPKVYHDKPIDPPSSPPAGPGVPFNGKGYIMVNDGAEGCLISQGTWYSSGTCATYHAVKSESVDGKISLRSSRGPCGVTSKGKFQCGNQVRRPSLFDLSDQGELSYNGFVTWRSHRHPAKWTKEAIWSGETGSNIPDSVDVKLTWKATR
ncbi:ribonuclease T2-like protein [Lipomyces japonicus]|uniref:ribonuclease T2-like protein n=1 Tax=Lipomyces japonicus TaxID=56871 RepID=UPI0034CF0D67